MRNKFSKVETPRNYEQKCLCVLCLDVSGSMEGTPIEELNKGLQLFASEVLQDDVAKKRLEVAIVTFSDEITITQEAALVEDFNMPTLEATYTTKLVDGVIEAIHLVEKRKDWYRDNGIPYYRPFIFLMTDGMPDDDQDVDSLSKRIHNDTQSKKYTFFSIGTGDDFDKQMLKKIAQPNIPPKALKGVKFINFFKWLSNSMIETSVSSPGQKVQFDQTGEWENDEIDWSGGVF